MEVDDCTFLSHLEKRRRNKSAKKRETAGQEPIEEGDTDLLYLNDISPLPYNPLKTKSLKASKEFDTLGFGAGGLPPMAFSHLARNWTQMMPNSTFGDVIAEDGGDYGPGVGLISLPWIEMSTGMGHKSQILCSCITIQLPPSHRL